MKKLYKFMFMLAFLQGVIVFVNVMNIFPYTFYDTAEVPSIDNPDDLPDAETWFISMFAPDLEIFEVPILDALSILSVFLGIGVICGIAMKGSFIPVVLAFQGYMVFTMIINSRSFFDKLLTNWGTPALLYLVLIFGLGIIMLFIVTILETASHSNQAE
jgi:hypothetical protein